MNQPQRGQGAPATQTRQAPQQDSVLNQAIAQTMQRETEYKPFGETESIKLNGSIVLKYLTHATRSGVLPTEADVIRFIMLCKARELNPWVGDAFLIGFDSADGAQFNLITSHQALMKRTEAHTAFDGLESGVVVQSEDGTVEYRQGDLTFDGEKLVGGWARLYRKDRSKPFYDALKLGVYNTGKSRWSKDPAGMVVKCAEASVVRLAFPTQTGGLLVREEMASTETSLPSMPQQSDALQETKRGLDDLLAGDVGKRQPHARKTTAPPTAQKPQEQPRQEAPRQQPTVQEPPPEEQMSDEPLADESEAPQNGNGAPHVEEQPGNGHANGAAGNGDESPAIAEFNALLTRINQARSQADLTAAQNEASHLWNEGMLTEDQRDTVNLRCNVKLQQIRAQLRSGPRR